MIINPETLDALYYSFKMDYQAAYEKAPTWSERVATTIPSSTKENHYAWAKQISALREWIGERKITSLEGRSYSIVNKKYELTIEVLAENLEDDNVGLYQAQIRDMGTQARQWPDDLIAELIMNGKTNLAFDGQPFFHASHPVDSSNASLGTYSNLLASSALSATTYDTARAQMGAYKGENGKSLKVNPNLLLVPPQLRATAQQILHADYIAPTGGFGTNAAQSQTNILKDSAELLVAPELASEPDAWYLLDVSRAIKPFVFQRRKEPEMMALTSPADENVFWRDTFVYGIKARGNAGYSLPFLALRGKA